MELGILTLLPPIVILLMALKTRNTTSSLLAGALLCCILQYKTGFLTGFIDLMYAVGCDEDTIWYVLFVALFGCVLGIWSTRGHACPGRTAAKIRHQPAPHAAAYLGDWHFGVH